ncbi:MAG: indole-3-glycerol phosphate synthase TrpC [Deltaproteobacteria bacterium]|nr:MAG: indole-3-glycerol phosphate synthase TrpC [Deltaproteobacteria bacterium]
MIPSRLLEIVREKEKEVRELKKSGISAINLPLIKRDFKKAISRPDSINIIAEIKFASPSAGTIRDEIDPIAIAKIYDEERASAISLLTDEKFFKGNISWLPEVKRTVSIPVLRKDFILDPIQLEEAKAYGADAILLIVRILSYHRLRELISISKDMDMAALVEVHDEEDIKKALDCGAEIIGINNRDLSTFRVDINTTIKLVPHIPDGYIVVSESGISDARDVEMLKKYKINAVLVGTSIMKSNDIRKKLQELVNAGKNVQI